MKNTAFSSDSASYDSLPETMQRHFGRLDREVGVLRANIAQAKRHFVALAKSRPMDVPLDLDVLELPGRLAAFERELIQVVPQVHCSTAWDLRHLQDGLTQQAEDLARTARQLRKTDSDGAVMLMRLALKWFDLGQPIFSAWLKCRAAQLREPATSHSGSRALVPAA